MSTFKSQRSTKTVDIRKAYTGTGIVMVWEGGSINLHPSDAPAIALAVLETAEMAAWCSGMSKAKEHAWDAAGSLRSAVRFTAAAAEEAARGKRRDELARDLNEAAYGPDATTVNYGLASGITQTAIDRIIDLEQERDGK